MINVSELYRQKRVCASDALALLQDGDSIIVPTAASEPPELLAALGEARRRFRDIKVYQLLGLGNYGYYDPQTTDHVRHVAYFLSGTTRKPCQEGWADLVPNHFSEIPRMIKRGELPADVLFAIASPMDEHGYFALSLGADYAMAAASRARAIVLEVNPNVPFAYGECHLHISQVAAVVESQLPLRQVGLGEIGEVQQTIGAYVAELVNDGDTLQIGFGGIPDAVVTQLAHKRDLGIHTEMIGDGIISLWESGAISCRKKNFLPGKMIATFALGTDRLYKAMHHNMMLEMRPSDFVNDPAIAGQNDNLVAINGTLQVDLSGQCGSESLGYKPFSSTGGQTDFIRAANRSNGGRGIIVTPSTAKGGTVSRISPTLTEGTFVSCSKNDVNYVVTEYGVAQLRGKSLRQRAQALIAIAHPDFRGELTAAAKKMNLL
ncbi:acetyl-CoA hydrolase/transferase family protein [Craterilacuibacter sp.]|uniref:acetyl-CoA hydrolase/transferase family protein n=1 Tax=Craterilacuibacter sp. TaxID=2870909 RepID=UPI003F35FDFC